MSPPLNDFAIQMLVKQFDRQMRHAADHDAGAKRSEDEAARYRALACQCRADADSVRKLLEAHGVDVGEAVASLLMKRAKEAVGATGWSKQ